MQVISRNRNRAQMGRCGHTDGVFHVLFWSGMGIRVWEEDGLSSGNGFMI
jgi:hypothetical protein